MFKPAIFTITRNMHKLSLQNYATVLPHQRELNWCRLYQLTMLIWLQACVLDQFFKSDLNLPLLWGKKGRTAIHWQVSVWNRHQRGLRTPYLLFCRELQQQVRGHGGPTTYPLHPIFWGTPIKNYHKWEFPQEVLSKSDDTQRCHNSLLKWLNATLK